MNIVLLDITDNYPKKFSANNSKAEYIARGLLENGCEVYIINLTKGDEQIDEITSGVSNFGIKYITFPNKHKYFEWLFKSSSIIKILKNCSGNEKNVVIIGMNYFHIFVTNSLISKLCGYKRTALFHEWHIGSKHSNFLRRFEAWLKDNTFGYFLNGIFPISSYLMEKSIKFNKRILKLPIIASYPTLQLSRKDSYEYFVYCAQADYYRIIKFVIDTYLLAIKKGVLQRLVIVLHGKEIHINKIQNIINEYRLGNCIEIKTKLLNEELIDLYKNALGLIIPLDPNSLQDTARFSQKIAEYVSSGRPIITSKTGEIPYYFKNRKSALIVPYTIESYADAMLTLSKDYELAFNIGNEGRDVGMKYFDYKKNVEQIIDFFEHLF